LRSAAEGFLAAAERARSVAEEVAVEGTHIRYVRSTFVPEDETCFHVFEAMSRETVAAVVSHVGFAGARLSEGIESAGALTDRGTEISAT